MNSETRKAQIVKTAIDIIAEDGSGNLVMLEIAKRIGVTDAALYRHFKTKNDMLLFMLERIEGSMIKNLIEHTNKYSNPKEKLRSILAYQLNFIQKNRSIPRILFSESMQFKDVRVRTKVRGIIIKYKNYVVELLRLTNVASNNKSKIDYDAVATIFIGMIQFTVVSWTLSNYSFQLSSKEADLWKEFSKVIK